MEVIKEIVKPEQKDFTIFYFWLIFYLITFFRLEVKYLWGRTLIIF